MYMTKKIEIVDTIVFDSRYVYNKLRTYPYHKKNEHAYNIKKKKKIKVPSNGIVNLCRKFI